MITHGSIVSVKGDNVQYGIDMSLILLDDPDVVGTITWLAGLKGIQPADWNLTDSEYMPVARVGWVQSTEKWA